MRRASRLASSRAALRVLVGLLALGACGLGAACVDLFHDTSFATLCEVDADAPGCGKDATSAIQMTTDGAADASVDSGLPLDICTLDASAASSAADHACAWLSACAGAFGGNDPGTCLFHAREVLDCRVAPARPARGSLLAVWRCLATAASCDDVGSCIEPGGTEQCPTATSGAFVACGGSAANAANSAVRIACSGTSSAPTAIDTCLTSGQTCGTFTSGAACGGGGTPNGTTRTCAASGCSGTVLQDCDDTGVDRGLDCANVGSGECVADRDSGALGCAVASDAGTCDASSAISCDSNGVATGCPSGALESVDCNALTGAPACDVTAAGRTWDVSRACAADAGCLETCTNGTIGACVGGVAATLDCKAAGLSGCSYTQVGSETHPTCLR